MKLIGFLMSIFGLLLIYMGVKNKRFSFEKGTNTETPKYQDPPPTPPKERKDETGDKIGKAIDEWKKQQQGK